jgi:5-(carboxyamino)imidazole ribonucleotide synthase
VKIGILGGGQLGLMLAEAASRLSIECRCLDPSPDAPARRACELYVDDYHDFEALHAFAQGIDAVTYEFENVPLDSVEFLSERVPVYPGATALEVAQQRVAEKTFFQAQGIPVAPFAAADSIQALDAAARRVGYPCIVKTCRYGYDGKGQYLLRARTDVENAWAGIGGAELIVEGFVNFERELSIIAVRSASGQLAFYPLVENRHSEGILRCSIAPAQAVSPAVQQQAEQYAAAVMEQLGYVGVLAIEFFEASGRLIANEMAPRVHNSGHWSIEGAAASQFENHVRAVCGLDPGPTSPVGCSVMLNVIGEEPALSGYDLPAGVYYHSYGKAARPRRKLAHFTLNAPAMEEVFSKWRWLKQAGLVELGP